MSQIALGIHTVLVGRTPAPMVHQLVCDLVNAPCLVLPYIAIIEGGAHRFQKVGSRRANFRWMGSGQSAFLLMVVATRVTYVAVNSVDIV